jgi:hypothetical protein
MPNNDYISALYLTDLLGEVRRDNNFIVTIEGVSTSAPKLELIVQQAFLPKVSLNVLNLQHGNDSKKFAGVATWEGGQLNIIDVLSQNELTALLAWFKQTYNWKKGTIGTAEKYKKKGYITEYASDGKYIRRWELEGMWISDFDFGQLDAQAGELKQIAATIQIDPSRSFAPTYDGGGEELDSDYTTTDGEASVDEKVNQIENPVDYE